MDTLILFNLKNILTARLQDLLSALVYLHLRFIGYEQLLDIFTWHWQINICNKGTFELVFGQCCAAGYRVTLLKSFIRTQRLKNLDLLQRYKHKSPDWRRTVRWGCVSMFTVMYSRKVTLESQSFVIVWFCCGIEVVLVLFSSHSSRTGYFEAQLHTMLCYRSAACLTTGFIHLQFIAVNTWL